MFPIVPLFCLTSILGGALGLRWYSRLSREEQERADRFAAQKAHELFGRPLDRLSASEAERVHALTQRHLVN